MGKFMTGKAVSESIQKQIIEKVTQFKQKNIFPKLTVVRCGNDGSDLAYEKGILKTMETCGIQVEIIKKEINISQTQFENTIKTLNADKNTHGILIFKPLPEQLCESKINNLITPEKDVDGSNTLNLGKVITDDQSGLFPCTPEAVMRLLNYYGISSRGKNVTLIGASIVVGKPLALMLINAGATVTICHKKTKDIKEMCQEADIVIAAAGAPRLIKANFIKKDSILVDVGINFVEGKMCGDIDEACYEKAGLITPVPGGVGGITTTILAENVVKACMLQN